MYPAGVPAVLPAGICLPPNEVFWAGCWEKAPHPEGGWAYSRVPGAVLVAPSLVEFRNCLSTALSYRFDFYFFVCVEPGAGCDDP